MAKKKRQKVGLPADTPLVNDPERWAGGPSPAPYVDVLSVQKEIDSIVGTTRGRSSIAKLVWNADVSYWKDVCIDWNSVGEPVEFIKRPIVLYRSVWNDHTGKLIHDVPAPRWLILTRMEPEQYAATWSTRVYHPDRKVWVQVKPSSPPKEWYVWFMTIADHNAHCCRLAAQEDRSCYGLYAHPRKCLQELGRTMEGVKASGIKDAPFDSPDELTANLRHDSVNNYTEQALRRYNSQTSRLLDSLPTGELKTWVADQQKRGIDRVMQDPKRLIIQG